MNNNDIKDLRKAAQDIMQERSTQAIKREKLLKIGLTNNDIQQLFFADRLQKRLTKKEQKAAALVSNTLEQILARYTFGVEIECYNAPVQSLLNKAFDKGINMRHEGYNHRDNNRYYKLVSDASIYGNSPIECVSPILKGNSGFNSLQACCDTLNEIGAMVNKTTGLHIHVGGQITEQQYANTFANYYYLENVIDTFMAASRRNNTYAKTMNNLNGITIDQMQTCDDVYAAFHGDRYFKINCCSWMRHHTIEFRQHQGTTDYTKISNWARFCIRLVHWSATHRLTAPVTSIDDIEFLTADEKKYYKERANHFATQQ